MRKAVIIVVCAIVMVVTIMPLYALPAPVGSSIEPSATLGDTPYSAISTDTPNPLPPWTNPISPNEPIAPIAPQPSVPPPAQQPNQPNQPNQPAEPSTGPSNPAPTAPTPSVETTPGITPELIARQEQARKIKERIADLARQIAVISEAYNQANLELTRLTGQLEEVRSRLRWFESELQVQQEQINERMVEIYKHGDADPLELIVDSTSFHDFLVRFNLLVRIGANDVDLLDRIHLQKRKIEEAKAELEKLRARQTKFSTDLAKKKTEAENRLREYQAFLAGLDEGIRALLNDEAAKDATNQATVRGHFRLGINVEPGSVVAVTMQYLGIPYVWGGETPQGGFDCSGLTRYVYLQFGVDLPHWVPYQWDMGLPVVLGNEQPGDLVFFHDFGHVGIYIGDGYFIHAPQTGDFVKISLLSERKDYLGAKRYIINVPAP